MESYKVVVTDDYFATYPEEERELGPIGARLDVRCCRTEGEAIAAVATADAILVNQLEISRVVIEAMPRCRVISRYGVGVDNVDVEAATAAGIHVAYVPDYGTEEVADHAFALLLACIRGIAFKDRAVRSGRWNLIREYPVHRSVGRVLGVVGFGRIGRAFLRRARCWGFAQLLVHDPFVDASEISEAGGTSAELESLLEAADYVSLHVPLCEETRHLIGKELIARMKPTAVLVNTSRGPVVDEVALERALREKQIAAAGLDVYEREPLAADSGLRELENVVLTDHAAYYSVEALRELRRKAAANIRAVLEGGQPIYAVNRLCP